MSNTRVLLVMFVCIEVVFLVPAGGAKGSGDNGNLRLCVVEGRGMYKRVSKYCPVLDNEKAGVECVLGTDRLDCLRRIGKGTVDFGVFSPEDLVAAQWARADVLVTNELRSRARPYERTIVAVANKRILPDTTAPLHAILKNRTLCHPGVGVDDIRPLSDTLAGYLESLVLPRSCDPKLSLAENRIKALSEFFGRSCKAGPWVLDEERDFELKRRYPSLCAACATSCSAHDQYWGDAGALACLVDHGDITWAELDDVKAYFGLKSSRGGPYPNAEEFVYLCRDGSTQPLANGTEPCVWLHRPWPVVVSERKAAEAVAALAGEVAAGGAAAGGARGALAALLEARQAPAAPLQPALVPADYLARARGFREAYSQAGCDPPRHINLCTTSVLERNKCEWLSEAGAVYGVAPPLQCVARASLEECMQAAERGEAVVQADSDWLLKGMRDYNLTPILHEATPIVEKSQTVVAYVKEDSGIQRMEDLRGKRAAFPAFDGFAFHSVARYIREKEKISCANIKGYFSAMCAPVAGAGAGTGRYNLTAAAARALTAACVADDAAARGGEVQALRAVVEGTSDVAFVSMDTYNLYAAKRLRMYAWARDPIRIVPICPEENMRYCFISWSNIGHIFASENVTSMRRQEIVNVFTKLDQLFGKHYPFHSAMFSMYGAFNHQMDVLFHNNTRTLATDDILRAHPYDKIPLNFERTLAKLEDSCPLQDFVNSGVRDAPAMLWFAPLVVFVIVS